MTAVEELLRSAEKLPPLPETAVKLGEVAQDRYATTEEIEAVIKYDQVVTASVLRVANSSFYATARPVGRLREAVLRLGSTMLFRIAMSRALRAIVSTDIRGYGIAAGEFWRHSVATGIGAQTIQQRISGETDATTFTVGLLHDVGKVVMSQHLAERYDELFTHAGLPSMPFFKIEQEEFGFDHAEVGSALAEHWRLPAEIAVAIREHHSPRAETPPLVDIVHVGDVLSLWMGTGIGTRGIQLSASGDALDRCGLSSEELESCACEAFLELKRVEGIFEA
jgi:putative nucleotidyltransferase with HDIG domain